MILDILVMLFSTLVGAYIGCRAAEYDLRRMKRKYGEKWWDYKWWQFR